MLSRFRHGPHSLVLLACSILFAMLLAACGGGGTTSSPTPTPTPTLAPSPTPSPTPSPATSLTTYTGDGYTIGYPSSWKANAQSSKVTFADSTGIYNMTIVVTPNPGGAISADTLATTGITAVKTQLKNPQDGNLPATTTVGGDSWVQKSTIGGSTAAGTSVPLEFVVISDNHPASSPSTKSFTIIYGTAQQSFASAKTSYFQPMLQSFKFTS
jgi:hypothetical protein